MLVKMHPKLAAARLRAAHTFPYFQTLLYNLVPIPVRTKSGAEGRGLQTMGVDMWLRLYYNEAWLESITVAETAGVLGHECFHILRDHHQRARAMRFDWELYNIAGDFAINDDLVKIYAARQDKTLTFPEGVLLPKRFNLEDGLLEEQYYRILQEKADEIREEMAQLIKDGKLLPIGGCGACSNPSNTL